MKIIYKLPQYFAIILSCLTVFVISRDIYQAKNTTFFDMIKSETIIDSSSTILGISTYWFLMFVGLFLTIVLAYLRHDMYDIKRWVSILIAIIFFLQAFLGAKILYGIEMAIIGGSINDFDMGGQSLYGTVFISFAFIPILAYILKKNVRDVYNYIAPFWLILLIFVRTGCYFNGCCGADACSVFGAEIILPVQLFEVVIDLIILQLVFNIEQKNRTLPTTEKNIENSFFITIGIYGVFRFLLEFIRNNSIIWVGMTFGQIYSIICVVIAITLIREKKNDTNKHNVG